MMPALRRRDTLKTIAAGACLAGVAGGFGGCQPAAPQFSSIDLTGAEYARDFALTDFDGRPRRLADFRGKALVVFFGYTQCPDVCPTTLGEMAQVKKLLGKDGERLQVVMVSLDPERDTPPVLKAYVRAFDPGFLGLYAASPEALAALASEFKVYFKKVPGAAPASYSVDHTAASFVYDPAGRLRLYVRYGAPPEAVAADVRALLASA